MDTTALEIRSRVDASGELHLSIEDVALEAPGADHVIVRVEAAPLNPSDLGLLLAAADLDGAVQGGTAERPTVTARVPRGALATMAARLGQSMTAGNEGAGTVVAAGSGAAAQALLGKRVAVLAGGMYATLRRVHVATVRALPAHVSAEAGASAFVNPLTALCFVETMRREGHTALVHTAAASNLGQMLVKVCAADRVPLVNIVRRPEQADLLRTLGAQHVIDSSREAFTAELVDALAATRATLAFDAIGGGRLGSQILSAMEAAATRGATQYSRYGSAVQKQLYIYGMLDRGPTELTRNYGMAWGISGWLVTPQLAKAGPARAAELEARVLAELTTTFASRYTQRVSLAEALHLPTLRAYARAATGEKYLVVP